MKGSHVNAILGYRFIKKEKEKSFTFLRTLFYSTQAIITKMYNLILSIYYIKHRIQITYRMFTIIGANGKLLTLNFHIDTGAATSSQNN